MPIIEENSSYTFYNGKLFFEKINFDTVKVVAAKERSFYAGNIIIPRSVSFLGSTYKVIKIAENAFYNCYNITSVYFEDDGIIEIEKNAFHTCSNIRSIHFPNSLKIIGESAFENLRMTNIKFPESLEIIEKKAFFDAKFTYLILPKNIKKIGDEAFRGSICHNSVLPDSLEVLGYHCLYFSNISNLRIGTKLKTINDQFTYSDCIKSFDVNSRNPFLISKDGIIYTKNETILISCPRGKEDEILYIPDSTQIIGASAFSCVWKIQNIFLPDSILEIREKAFCNSRGNINIPLFVRTIGAYAYSLSKIQKIVIPSTVKEIQDFAFSSCDVLQTVEIKDGLIHIPKGCFSNCRKLTTINLPNSIRTINDLAFESCVSLQSLKIPSSVVSIGKGICSSACKELIIEDCPSDRKNAQIQSKILNVDFNYPFSGITKLYIGRELFPYIDRYKNIFPDVIEVVIGPLLQSGFISYLYRSEKIKYIRLTSVSRQFNLHCEFSNIVIKNATLIIPSGTKNYIKNNISFSKFI